MPQQPTLSGHSRAASIQAHPDPTPPIPLTTVLLRVVAWLWITVSVLASLFLIYGVLFMLGRSQRGGGNLDGDLLGLVIVVGVSLGSWTVGLSLSWMANLSDDLRAKAGR